MRKKLIISLGALLLVAMVVAMVVKTRKKPGTEVYVSKVEAGKVVSVVSANGEIQARTKVNISSNVWGQIIAIPVKEGDLVRKRDVLMRIDPTQYESQVRSLEASLRMARVGVEQEENRNKTLAAQFRRAEGLRSQGILDEESYDQSRLSYDSSTIQLKSLKESIEQAAAALQKARDDLGKTTIFAPMDGKVTQLNTEVGEQVIVGTTNIPGSSIMVISDMSEVLAEVNVDETEVVRVAVGQPAKVSVDAVEKKEYRGHVSEIRNSASKKQDVNVFGVKVQLDDPEEKLRPGMSARARIEIEHRTGVLRVPIQAVLEKTRKAMTEEIAKAAGKTKKTTRQPDAPVAKAGAGGGAAASDAASDGSAEAPAASTATPAGSTAASTAPAASGNATADADGSPAKAPDEETIDLVYVLSDGTVHLVEVKTGLSDETNVEVLSGLKDGDTVVTGPYRTLRKLKHGDKAVEKKDEEGATETPKNETKES